MTISYNWISEYIPEKLEPQQVSTILTSIGLEVESMERYESLPGGLKGLVVGEVMESFQHPGADKLKLTRVNVGEGNMLQIVCGAPNVAAGQKVVVAKVGTTIYPIKGEPITMKTAKIRGEESFGMICAEDEIGIGESHAGIIVLPESLQAGTPVSDYYRPYSDWVYEIGLTPNRMDAMSHLGVARDVCAYLAHHHGKDVRSKNVFDAVLPAGNGSNPFQVMIENEQSCRRYAGITLGGINIGPSPQWMQDKLRSIGQRPINNIVDITNFILHDTGQPLHAYDADLVPRKKIVVRNLPANSIFKTLDGKERKLATEDLMICDDQGNGLCIAGVFGGESSGVRNATRNIFLESAWFNPQDIRKTSFRHGLRTDAAAHFEKNVDISNTVNVLKRAAALIIELCGATVTSDIIDVYPAPPVKQEVEISFLFLHKLSGKKYTPSAAREILLSLGFEVVKETDAFLRVSVPSSKPDITVPADLVEEIMRIDGYDNVGIPTSITITPSTGAANPDQVRKENTSNFLVGAGFNEIFTNSITNAAYFENEELLTGVRLLNNLSAVHNIMRPSMLQTGLEAVAYNLNRKNHDLRFFEFGKTYHSSGAGQYAEEDHLCLYVTGKTSPASWKEQPAAADIYYLKGIVESISRGLGLPSPAWTNPGAPGTISLSSSGQAIATAAAVPRKDLSRFDIRQPVYFADIHWGETLAIAAKEKLQFQGLPNQLPVHRDLAMVVPRSLPFKSVEDAVNRIRLGKLRSVTLFDVFESDKLGAGKKSFAVSFTFLDGEKTLTDTEIDGMMKKIMHTLEQDLSAEIRKA